MIIIININKFKKSKNTLSAKEVTFSIDRILKPPMLIEEIIADGIEKYIEKPCIEPCQVLWFLNVETFESNANSAFDEAWIALLELSEENQIIFDELAKSYPHNYKRSYGLKEGESLHVNFDPQKPNQTIIDFLKLIKNFKMQDISKRGYQTIEDFLINTYGCYKEVPNPEYIYMEPVVPSNLSSNFEEIIEYMEYKYSLKSKKVIKVLDKTKMKKSAEQYIATAGLTDLYIPNEGKIYKNQFYLNNHKRYLQYLLATKVNQITSFKER